MKGWIAVVALIACGGTSARAPDNADNADVADRDRRQAKRTRDELEARRVVAEDLRCAIMEDGRMRCAYETKEDCTEIRAKLPESYRPDCPEDLPSREHLRTAAAAAETQRRHDERKERAEQALRSCQRPLDDGDIDAAIACWDEQHSSWSDVVESQAIATVSRCLAAEKEARQRMETCVAAAEHSEADILAKQRCLESGGHSLDRTLRGSTNECAPLDVTTLRAHNDRVLDIARVKARIATKAAAIEAKRQRCHGENAIGLAVALRMTPDIKATKLRGCVYTIVGTVASTTTDGWVIVSWNSLGVAVKTRKRYVDGALLNAAGARFLGVLSFRRVNGGTATIATFVVP